MSFKKGLLCLGLSAVAFSSASMAASITDVSTGTVDFTGSIVSTPCAITAANQNLQVPLGQVKSSSFTKKGDTASDKPGTINIVLSNCTVSTPKPYNATVTFDGKGTDANKSSLQVDSGNDTSGGAVAIGVGIQILDATSTPLNLGVLSQQVPINKSEMTLPFTARYISTADTVTPGLANAHATFTVSYN